MTAAAAMLTAGTTMGAGDAGGASKQALYTHRTYIHTCTHQNPHTHTHTPTPTSNMLCEESS